MSQRSFDVCNFIFVFCVFCFDVTNSADFSKKRNYKKKFRRAQMRKKTLYTREKTLYQGKLMGYEESSLTSKIP